MEKKAKEAIFIFFSLVDHLCSIEELVGGCVECWREKEGREQFGSHQWAGGWRHSMDRESSLQPLPNIIASGLLISYTTFKKK
jgi:hypothetical protein